MQNDKVIHCRCDPKSECMTYSSIGNTCATNEGCFKSININLQTGKRYLNMGCFKNKSQHYLMQCKVKIITGYEIKCCRDSDFCNNYLSLPSDKLLNFTDHAEKPRTDHFINESTIHLVLAIVVPICVLVILAGLITLFWKSLGHHKRKAGLKLLHHSKPFQDSSLIKTHLISSPDNINSNVCRANSIWQMEALVDSGSPGSKSSTDVGVKSNGTAVTFLSEWKSGNLKLRDDTCTSGSGSGLPFLVQRTVARQITLLECIGKGKFGEVWKGKFQGELVAVKIFSSREELSWTRETTIYNTVLLRHDNVLGYYASDLISKSGCTQLWMVMEYHALGSLNDYLTHNSLSISTALRLAHSAAAGLCHLHTSIVGLQGKPAIAHRDIKSKNILVKNNGTCCIADLGLAVFSLSGGSYGIITESNNIIVGTKRYMAPELLEIACSTASLDVNAMDSNGYSTNSIHEESSMDSFKAVDVYAFSLVLWEIVTCVVLEDTSLSYQLPFAEMVDPDPSFQDMYRIVVEKQRRPIISDSIKKHLNPVSKIIEECWHHQPSTRLSMLRVKKSLFLLINQISCLQNESLPGNPLPTTDANNATVPFFRYL